MAAAIGLLLIANLVATQTSQDQSKAQGQDQNQSGIIVVKNSWRKGVRGADLNRPIFDQSPQSRNPNSSDPWQQMRQAERRMAARVEGYYYNATITNAGPKAIKALAWDYTVTSPGDPKSLTHHQFYTRINIRPGKRKDIYRFAIAPPTRTVAASKGDARLIEEVVINAVQYADGSVWRLQR